MLHEENASVLTLLPSFANGLISQVSQVEVILKFIDQEVSKLRQNQEKLDRLLHVKEQLGKAQIPSTSFCLDIDEKKSIILAYAFGELYTPALALLTGNHISIQFWGLDHGVPSLKTIEECVQNPSGGDPIFFQVSNNPSTEIKADEPDVNTFLQLRAMVAKLGLLMNLSTFDLEGLEDTAAKIEESKRNGLFLHENGIKNAPKESGQSNLEQKPETLPFQSRSKVIVDPYNWFCCCEDFTMKCFVTHDRNCSEILERLTDPLMVKKLFESTSCNYPRKLPICKHLLAVILMLFNWSGSIKAGLVKTYWVVDETRQVEIPQ